MRLTQQELTSIKDQLRGTKEWALFSGYRDWRLSGQDVRAKEIAKTLKLHLATIVEESVLDGDPQAILDDLFEDDVDRLKAGMEPVPYEETDLNRAVAYFSGIFPLDVKRDALARPHIEAVIARLHEFSEPGDQLFICRSRYLGPLAGHEGLGLVRDGRVVQYEALVHY